LLAKAPTLGGTGLGLARSVLSNMNGAATAPAANGATSAAVAQAVEPPPSREK
jgi:hypothetical protein